MKKITPNRIKVALDTPANRAEAEALMTSLAASVNAQRGVCADRDKRVLAINKEFEAGLAVLAKAIDIKTMALQRWAESNPDEFPKDRKSIAMTSGVLGFRTGTPKVALLSRAWTWEKVLAALKQSIWGIRYVRTKEELDKETLLLATKGPVFQDRPPAETLAIVGIKVTQSESFFVEPSLTELETRQTQAA